MTGATAKISTSTMQETQVSWPWIAEQQKLGDNKCLLFSATEFGGNSLCSNKQLVQMLTKWLTRELKPSQAYLLQLMPQVVPEFLPARPRCRPCPQTADHLMGCGVGEGEIFFKQLKIKILSKMLEKEERKHRMEPAGRTPILVSRYGIWAK